MDADPSSNSGQVHADYHDFKKLNHEGHPELNERTHLTGQAKKHEGKVVLGWVLVICQSLRDLVFQFVEIPICIYLRQSVS